MSMENNMFEKMAEDILEDFSFSYSACDLESLARYLCVKFNEYAKCSEKENPMKPTHEASKFSDYTCPRCKNVVDRKEKWEDRRVRILPKYCEICGQKIDWSDIFPEEARSNGL